MKSGNLKLKAAGLFLLLVGIMAFSGVSEAVMANPEIHERIQDGQVVRYQVRGDEFFSYIVDTNGDLLIFGADGDLYKGEWMSEPQASAAYGSGSETGGGRIVLPCLPA